MSDRRPDERLSAQVFGQALQRQERWGIGLWEKQVVMGSRSDGEVLRATDAGMASPRFRPGGFGTHVQRARDASLTRSPATAKRP